MSVFTSKQHFPGGSDSKESACHAGDPGSIPGLRRSPGEGNGNPLQYSCLENSMDRGAWQVHGVLKSRTWLSNFHLQQRSKMFCSQLRERYTKRSFWCPPSILNFLLCLLAWKYMILGSATMGKGGHRHKNKSITVDKWEDPGWSSWGPCWTTKATWTSCLQTSC